MKLNHTPAPRTIRIRVLGDFDVEVDGLRLPGDSWKLRHPRQLLQMLCVSVGGQVSRDEVLERLWPRSGVGAAANRLYHTLHVLKGVFGQAGVDREEPVVVLGGGVVRLSERHEVEVDVQRFRQAIVAARGSVGAARVRVLEEAVAGYGGELLSGQPLEDWLIQPREEHRLGYVWALDQLAGAWREAGRVQQAIGLYQKLVEVEAANELAHRALMELFDASGHPERAVYQYTACKRYLQRDLDAEPSPATQAVLARIVARSRAQRAQAAGVQAEQGGARAVAAARYRAPAHAVALLGREADLQVLQRWLQEDGTRLVTIAAVAGQGKTRLAQALAERVQGQYADGVVAVSLTGLSQAGQLAEHLLGALGVEGGSGAPLQRLKLALSERRVLLLLDRFEHLLEGAQVVSELLQAAAGLTVVVTSQAPLRSQAERVYRLPSLIEGAGEAAVAVELFRRVAGNLGMRWEEEASRGRIEAICRRLGGNALAIELAAGQTQALTLEQIGEGLARPLDLLTSSVRDVEPPQRSLREAIAWSYRTLPPPVQHTLCLLGVFAGSFDLDDAQGVLAGVGHAASLAADLPALVDRGLVTRRAAPGPGGEAPRLDLLDAVRQFAHEAAQADPQWTALCAAHARHYFQLAVRLHELDSHGRGGEAMRAYRPLMADVRRARDWYAAEGDAADHLQIVAASCALEFLSTGATCSVAATARGALERVDAADPRQCEQAGVIHALLARVYIKTGEIAAAARTLRLGRRISAAVDNDLLKYRLERLFASVRMSQLRFRVVDWHVARMGRSPAGVDPMVKIGSHFWGVMMNVNRGRLKDAAAHAHAALDVSIAGGQPHYLTASLYNLGSIAVMRGDVDGARSYLAECRQLAEAGYAAVPPLSLQRLAIWLEFESDRAEVAVDLLAQLRSNDDRRWTAVQRQMLDALDAVISIESGRLTANGAAALAAADRLVYEHESGGAYILLWCTRIRWCARQGDWSAAHACLAPLTAIIAKVRNPLWYAWLLESAAHALLAAGRPAAAASLARRCAQALTAEGMPLSPRLQRSLRQLGLADPAAAGAGAEPVTSYSAALAQLQALMDEQLVESGGEAVLAG